MMGEVEPRPSVLPRPTTTPGGAASVSFRRDVAPIFGQNCTQCHGGQAGLFLESYDLIAESAFENKVIVPRDAERSVLLKRIRGDTQPRMPLGGRPLSAEQITTIETWIREGASNN